jgi:4-hydroxy-tetrahydrodipicolinate synthase
VRIPIVVYSVQGRTGVNVEPATLRRLARIPNIAGVKEASGNIAQMASICATMPEDFSVMSGDDAITLALAGLGGHGIISVASNEIPAEMAALAQACLDGDFARARSLQKKWLPLMEVNFVESNPMPVKYAMARMGLLEPVWRQPMIAPSESAQQKIDAVLRSLELIQ